MSTGSIGSWSAWGHTLLPRRRRLPVGVAALEDGLEIVGRRCCKWMVLLVVASACDIGPITEPVARATVAPSTASDLATLEIKADYPRYLRHLRRLNLETTNAGSSDIVVTRHVLITEHFGPQEPEVRRSLIKAGTRVDLQANFGELLTCEDSEPLSAWVLLDYTTGLDPTTYELILPIDAAPLDRIRDNECAQQAVHEAVDVQFGDGAVSGETVTVPISLDRVAGSEPIVVTELRGSVVFKLVAAVPAEIPLLMKTGIHSSGLATVFSPVRCDPHAVSQSTKTYEFNIWVTVGEHETEMIPIPLPPGLRDQLDEVLDACISRVEAETP